MAGLAMVGVASNAGAATVLLGASGWQASWDNSLDPYVDVHVVATGADEVFIQKSAEFTQGPNQFGLFPTIPIVFRQIAANAVSKIIIEDEIITNSTGTDWTDFHMDILNMGDAWFAHPPGFFFTTSPFDNQSFSPDSMSFNVDGFGLGPGGSNAVVPSGSTWFPGDGVTDGELVIQTNPHAQAPFEVFTLKETPTPEPATLALLAIGALAATRRR
jgi:hypothetical protein